MRWLKQKKDALPHSPPCFLFYPARGPPVPPLLPPCRLAPLFVAAMAAPPPAISPADVHVLLVDDDRLPRLVVASQLKKFNYKGVRERASERESTGIEGGGGQE